MAGKLPGYCFFAEPDDALKCPICLEVAVLPWQHGTCGRLFCKECLEKYGKDKPCPNCRAKKPSYFEDTKSNREIRALRVLCAQDQHCGWEGTLGTLEKHPEMCRFLPCPKQCQDTENRVQQISRRDLERHLQKDCPNREYECEHCGEKGTYAHITQVHDETCDNKILPCSNSKCLVAVERRLISYHIERDCGYTVISCRYHDLGCDVKLKRHDMTSHEADDDNKHLHMALDAVVSLKKTVAVLEERRITLQPGGTMLLKVTRFEERRQTNEIFKSPPFYTSANGYHMTILVYVNGCGYGRGTHVSIYTRILQGKHDKELTWPFAGTLNVQLLNQLKDEDHHVKDIKTTLQSFDVDTGTIRGSAKFISHSKMGHDPTTNTEYLKNDTLYLRVSVDVPGQRDWLEWSSMFIQ